jgi:hypothetical protein
VSAILPDKENKMAKATFVKAARKAVPSAGIEVGDSYWWWKFRYGGKHYSKTRPKQSQLTRSEFYGQIYSIQEEIEELQPTDELQSQVEDIANRLRDLGEEQSSKRDNMPDSLQDSATGELLQERADACENAASELESIDFPDFDEEAVMEELKEENEDADEDELNELLEERRTEHYGDILTQVQDVSIEMP